MDRQLFGCYLVKLFKQHMRLLPETFDYLCGILSPSLSCLYTKYRAFLLEIGLLFLLIDLVVVIHYVIVLKHMEFMKVLHLSLLGSFVQQLRSI